MPHDVNPDGLSPYTAPHMAPADSRLASAVEAALPLLERIAQALETHAIIGDDLSKTIKRAAEGDEPGG